MIFCCFSRHFFEPDAGADNDIPVVNIRLSDADPVLLNAPLAGSNLSFCVFVYHSLCLNFFVCVFLPFCPCIIIFLSSKLTVFFLSGYNLSLSDYSLQIMDFIFSHDNPYFLVNKLTTVEKLGHAYQMHAVWAETQKFYLELKKNPPANIDQVKATNFCKQ